MSKSKLTWYKSQANEIMRDLKRSNKSALAREINESRQTFHYRIENMYQEQLEDWIRILKHEGWVIRREDE